MINSINVTTVVEHAFCPKFTYYSYVLGLQQYEEKRGTVSVGRKFHTRHEKTNTSYLRKKFGNEKILGLKMYSKKYDFAGIVDEAVISDDEILLVERKYSDYNHISPTIKVQIGLLSLLLEESFGKPVRKALIIFSKDKRTEIIIDIDDSVRNFALEMLNDVRKVISLGISPKSKYDGRCVNCCYRRVCPVGSLNMVE
jgi:CRISPR-associated exonuclease Cas4